MRATEGSWLSAVVVAIGLCVLGLAGLRTAATRARAPAGPAAQQYHRARQVLLGQRDGIVVVAHRGRSRPNAVENSLTALSQAIQDGVPMAEVDVRLTADGVPVLMHDRSLERTVGVGAAVADLTLAQLRQYRLLRADEPVPTLREALELAVGRILLNLDVKIDQLEPVVREIARAEALDGVLVYVAPARRERTAIELMRRWPRLQVMMRAEAPEDLQRIARYRPRPRVLHVNGRAPSRELCRRIRRSGFAVFIYPQGWTRFWHGQRLSDYARMGANFVQTDRPLAMLGQMRRLNRLADRSAGR